MKVKSNPFLMESNCMKMYRAGLRGGREKNEHGKVKRKGNEKLHLCARADRQRGREVRKREEG